MKQVITQPKIQSLHHALPHEIPTSANALLRLRFAYLTKEQRQSILASTAYRVIGWLAANR